MMGKIKTTHLSNIIVPKHVEQWSELAKAFARCR